MSFQYKAAPPQRAQRWDIRPPPPQSGAAHRPAPEPGRRRHALAREWPPETCLQQSTGTGDMTAPEPGQRRHACNRASALSSPVPFGRGPPVCAVCLASLRLGEYYTTMIVDLAKRSTSYVFTFWINSTFCKLHLLERYNCHRTNFHSEYSIWA